MRGVCPARRTVIGPDAGEDSAFALPDYEDALGNLPTSPGKVEFLERSSGQSERQFIWNRGDHAAMVICAGGGHPAQRGRSDPGR